MQSTSEFRNKFSEDIWNLKYNQGRFESWAQLCDTLTQEVCEGYMTSDEISTLAQLMKDFKWLPGGRYLYYAGRPNKFYNNCFLYKSQDDTREDWANTFRKITSALMTGGGIGNDYSIYRASNKIIAGTGGLSSGPIPAMHVVNDLGRQVMQGGSRRSALYASLDETHDDIYKFLAAKDWATMRVAGTKYTIWDLKAADFNYQAPLDMTNISVNYHTDWALNYLKTREVGDVFKKNVYQAMSTGEPGFSFNFFERNEETLRNAPVSGKTRVMTPYGYKTIESIAEMSEKVWTGKQWARTTFKKTKVNASTVNVVFTGNRHIIADLEHPFFVERQIGKGKRSNFTIEKVNAKDLQVGDTLVSTLPDVVEQPFNSLYYTLGFIYGDGSLTVSGADLTIADKTKLPCLDHFYVSKIRRQSITPEGYTRIYFNSFLETNNKDNFPTFVDNHEIAGFLAGLFDADGSYDSKHKAIRFSSSRYDHITWVREYLEILGIHSTISKPSTSGYSNNPNWTLIVLRSDNTKFKKVIPTVRLKVEEHITYRPSKIKVTALLENPSEDVYCCDVGVEEHSFCAEGVIISNCTEVTSFDDSDVCNLGSLNLSRIKDISELITTTELVVKFLLCGTMRAILPHQEVYATREKNRRLGLGLMGIHEWLLMRGYRYEMTPELKTWLHVWKGVSDDVAKSFSNSLSISNPVGVRAIAPTGSIAILAGTTGGIEPLYAVAYKRRYLKEGTKWHYQYNIDSVAEQLISEGVDPDKIETALDLAKDPERRIKFQADIQDYVDQGISSTINLPAWGTHFNNEDTVSKITDTLAKYALRLRGFTCYPDGARGGQPLSTVPYQDVKELLGSEFEEHISTNDVCEIGGKGGTCGA